MKLIDIIKEEVKLFLEKRPRIGSVDMGKKIAHDDPAYNSYITSEHLNSLERELDALFAGAGIDIEFTKHFLDRVNDPRNKKDITIDELRAIFKEVYSKYKDDINKSGASFQAVIKSLSTDINIPFALEWDEKNQEMDLVSKTVMRKKGFQTSNPILSVKENSAQYPVALPPEYGDSDYEARGGKIFMMSPEKFLKLSPALNVEDEDSKDNIEDLKNMMEKGVKIDPPTLYLNNNKVVDHDGRHRAYAAIELGIDKMPVLVIDKNNETITTFPTS